MSRRAQIAPEALGGTRSSDRPSALFRSSGEHLAEPQVPSWPFQGQSTVRKARFRAPEAASAPRGPARPPAVKVGLAGPRCPRLLRVWGGKASRPEPSTTSQSKSPRWSGGAVTGRGPRPMAIWTRAIPTLAGSRLSRRAGGAVDSTLAIHGPARSTSGAAAAAASAIWASAGEPYFVPFYAEKASVRNKLMMRQLS